MRPLTVLHVTVRPLWLIAVLIWLLLTYVFVHFSGWKKPVAYLLTNDSRVETLMPDAQLLVGVPSQDSLEIAISFESGYDSTKRTWNTVVKPRHARLMTSQEQLLRDLPGPLLEPRFIDLEGDGKSEVACKTLVDQVEPGVLIFSWPELKQIGSFILRKAEYMPDSLPVPWDAGIDIGPLVRGDARRPTALLLRAGCGYGLAPRGIIAIDPKRVQTERWHVWTASSIDQLELLETAADGEPHIFFSTYSPANGAIVDTLNDRTSYLGMLSRDGVLQWIRAWGTPFTSLTFYPLEEPVSTFIVARTSIWEPAGANRIYRVAAAQGSIQDSLLLTDRSDRNFFAPTAKASFRGAPFIVLEGGLGYAEIQRQLVKTRVSTMDYALRRVLDIERDGRNEFEARDAFANSVIVSAGLEPLLQFSQPCDPILFQHADSAIVCWYLTDRTWHRAWVTANPHFRWASLLGAMLWIWLGTTLLLMGTMLYRVNQSNLHERALLKFMRHSIIERLEEFIEPVRRSLSDSGGSPRESQQLAVDLARYQRRADKIKNTTWAVRQYLGDVQMDMEQLSLYELLASIRSQWMDEDLRRIEVVCPADIAIRGNRVALQEVFAQLIENSDRFFRSLPYDISIKVASLGNRVHIRYADNGLGIRPQIRRSLFKLGVSTKGEEKVSRNPGAALRIGRTQAGGFGMYYVKQILGQHDGTIRVESPALGAEFVLTFPLDNEREGLYA